MVSLIKAPKSLYCACLTPSIMGWQQLYVVQTLPLVKTTSYK